MLRDPPGGQTLPRHMSSSRGSLTPPSLPAGRLSHDDDGTELVVRGRSFLRSPPPAEIEPAESSAPAPAQQLQPKMDRAADMQGSPFAVELPAQEAEAAGLELQPMLLGTAGDSSAVIDADTDAHPVPLAWQPPADGSQSKGLAEPPRDAAADRSGVVAAQRASSSLAGPVKHDWHAAIRQRLKLRVRTDPGREHFLVSQTLMLVNLSYPERADGPAAVLQQCLQHEHLCLSSCLLRGCDCGTNHAIALHISFICLLCCSCDRSRRGRARRAPRRS